MYSQTPITGMLNSYARVTAIAGNVLTVSNITGFSPNQEVLIYQTQDANIVTNPALGTFGQITAINSTGLFEIDTILSITGNTITLNSVALYHTYNSASALQIVSIPNYPLGAQLTGNITGTAWNGSIGGIITLRTPVLDLNGSCIVASGLGFRGGTVAGNMNTSNPIPNPNSAFTTIFGFGQKGESVTLDLGALNLESGTAPSANGGGAGVGRIGEVVVAQMVEMVEWPAQQ